MIFLGVIRGQNKIFLYFRWEASYRGIPIEPHGIDENIEFFIPVLKEIESILWKYGIKLNIQRDEILYNKVSLTQISLL